MFVFNLASDGGAYTPRGLIVATVAPLYRKAIRLVYALVSALDVPISTEYDPATVGSLENVIWGAPVTSAVLNAALVEPIPIELPENEDSNVYKFPLVYVTSVLTKFLPTTNPLVL